MLSEALPSRYRTAVESRGYVPLERFGIVQLSGQDRATVMHNLCTQDIKSLPQGAGAEAFVTSVQGRIVGHVFVLCLNDRIWILCPNDQAPGVVAHCGRYVITEDAEFVDFSPGSRVFGLLGPESARLHPALPSLSVMWRSVDATWESIPVTLVRGPLDQPLCFLCVVTLRDAEQFVQILTERGIPSIEPEVFRVLRMESGLPEFGTDITSENLPQEIARDARAISFRKGCYLGQETVARIDALGHVNRILCAWQSKSPEAFPPGTSLIDAGTGKLVGAVTSSVVSPRHGGILSMGYIRRGYADGEAALLCGDHEVELVRFPGR